MSATGYTTIYNEVLRDSTLSLDAKGLFAVIKSFVGLPGFALSKRRLGYACSDSGYLLNAAWKELKQKGYLQHYFSQSENGAFCHVYNLMQHPSEPVDFVYSRPSTARTATLSAFPMRSATTRIFPPLSCATSPFPSPARACSRSSAI